MAPLVPSQLKEPMHASELLTDQRPGAFHKVSQRVRHRSRHGALMIFDLISSRQSAPIGRTIMSVLRHLRGLPEVRT
jgi:hypothetical protein